MSRMIKLLCFAVILFSVAAAASWYLQVQQHKEDGAPKAGDEKAAKSAAKGGAESAQRPPLFRSSSTPESEDLAKFSLTLQKQQEGLKQRHEQLNVRENQLNLIHDEIKKEQKKLDAVRTQIEAEMQLVQDKLDELEKKTVEVDRDRKKAEEQVEEIRRLTKEFSIVEEKNLKRVASIYDKMDAAAAAPSIQYMVEKSNLDAAVTILLNMRQSPAANILAEISQQEPGIAVQLTDRMRSMKSASTTPK